MIVKAQKAIWPPDGPVLIYPRSRRFMRSIPMTPEISEMFGDRLKMYCRAKLDRRRDSVTLIRTVNDENW